METQLSIDMVRVHKGDVCYLCDNSFGQATCGGTKTIFAKYEVPNLSDKVESMYAVVRDMKRDGMFIQLIIANLPLFFFIIFTIHLLIIGTGTYDPSTDTTLHKLKKDLSKRGITLKVIYIEADKQHHFDIFEHIVEAIRKSWGMSSDQESCRRRKIIPVLSIRGAEYHHVRKCL